MYAPDRSIPVIVQVRDALEALLGMTKAEGSIALSGQPSDGDYVAVNGVTFEFDSGGAVTAGRVLVTIAATAALSLAALVAAMQERLLSDDPDIGLFAYVTAAAPTVSVGLTYYDVGEAGNLEITKSGTNITVVGMSGGRAGVV